MNKTDSMWIKTWNKIILKLKIKSLDKEQRGKVNKVMQKRDYDV